MAVIDYAEIEPSSPTPGILILPGIEGILGLEVPTLNDTQIKMAGLMIENWGQEMARKEVVCVVQGTPRSLKNNYDGMLTELKASSIGEFFHKHGGGGATKHKFDFDDTANSNDSQESNLTAVTTTTSNNTEDAPHHKTSKTSSSDWMKQGNCKDEPPSRFFPSDGVGVDVAKRICNTCPVREVCLDYALTHRIDHGVWGGASERERKRILKRRRAWSAVAPKSTE
jgi:WhiB family redox-sensing transcriptional regulator